MDDDDDDQIFFNADLFLNENYEEKTFHFMNNNITQTILCSTAATTDHDLTGQIVWPVSEYLSEFIVSRQTEFQNKQILELGAGCGLAGMVASQFGSHTVITDGNEVVLRMLAQTKELAPSNKVSVQSLVWGDLESINCYCASSPNVDIIIGADVICWPKLVLPLLNTVKLLMQQSKNPNVTFYCGFVNRANATENLMYQMSSAIGLRVTKMPFTSPTVPSGNVLQLISFQLDEQSPQSKISVQFNSDILELQTAC